MQIFLVGGAVRDTLLGVPVRERDWVVVGASRNDMLELGYRQTDPRFPVFLHPETGEEYALARRETKIAAGHRGFAVEATPDVTLEEDLARRDLRINAIADGGGGALVDPFSGRDDLDARMLRHVTPAFREDPLRVLRAARFCATLGHLGFELAPETNRLMAEMIRGGELTSLSGERIWRETARALAAQRPARYIEALARCGALESLLGGPAPSPELAIRALTRAAETGADVETVAAVAAAALSPSSPGDVAVHLGAPASSTELARLLGSHGLADLVSAAASADSLMSMLEALDALRRVDRFARYAGACAALAGEDPSAHAALERLRIARRAASSVRADGLVARGLGGPALGRELRLARITAIADALSPPGEGVLG